MNVMMTNYGVANYSIRQGIKISHAVRGFKALIFAIRRSLRRMRQYQILAHIQNLNLVTEALRVC